MLILIIVSITITITNNSNPAKGGSKGTSGQGGDRPSW